MNKTFLLASVAAVSLAAGASAQITLIDPATNNGSFETSPGAKTDFTPTTSSAAAIPYWGGTTPTPDTGVDVGVDVTQNGTKGAFEQGGTGIFNLVTSRPIATGDVYTLTFYGRSTVNAANVGIADPLVASLYSQAAPAAGTAYGYTTGNTVLVTATETLSNAAAFGQYTLTYTATAADAGNDIGISAVNTGGNYNGLDNFVLTVTPGAAAPEPSTYAMMLMGLGGLTFVLRARRSVV